MAFLIGTLSLVSVASAWAAGPYRLSDEPDAPYSGPLGVAAADGARGTALVAWEGTGVGESSPRIYARPIDGLGKPTGPAVQVSGDASAPALAYDAATGEFLIAWSGDRVYARRLTAEGRPKGDRVALGPPAGRYAAVGVASAGAAGFLVAWQPASAEAVPRARRLTRAGRVEGGHVRLSEDAADPATGPPAVAFERRSGRYVVAWSERTTDPAKILARSVTPTGATGPRVVAGRVPIESLGAGHLAVAAGPGGGVLVAWPRQVDGFGSAREIAERIVDGAARPRGPERAVDPVATTFFSGVSAVFEPRLGDYLVAWRKNDDDTYDHCTGSDSADVAEINPRGTPLGPHAFDIVMPGRIGSGDSGSPCPVYSILLPVLVAGGRAGGVAVWAGTPLPARNARHVWARPVGR